MEKISIERNREDLYIIEVNDKGDTIEFDLTDINLPQRILEAGENLEKLGDSYKKETKEIFEKYKTEEEQAEAIIRLDYKHAKEQRKIFDSFMGEGACYKIFGDREGIGQYNKLLEALEPHFEKMKFKREKAQQKLASKYMEKKSDVI